MLPSMNSGLEKCVNIKILDASFSSSIFLLYNSLTYLALLGKPDIILIIKTNDASPLTLKSLYIIGLNNSAANSINPKLINISDNTKKGNKDGKILFVHILKEKITVFKIVCDSVSISIPIKIKIIIDIILINIFFIKSP